jgi:hypothetical protein
MNDGGQPCREKELSLPIHFFKSCPHFLRSENTVDDYRLSKLTYFSSRGSFGAKIMGLVRFDDDKAIRLHQRL